MPPTWRTIALDRGDHGVRVDRVLLRHLRNECGVSRNRIQKWIEAGGVLINGVPAARPAWRVQAGDDLRVRLAPAPARARPASEAMALDVLFEDEHILAVNKPAGLVVHPCYKNTDGTLMNGVLARAQSWPAGSKPALVGRLDKQTSGVVLVTKRPEVHAALQRAMDARRIDKDYLAVVWGRPTPMRGTIDLALDRDPWDRRRITVTDRGGQPSVTRYERIAVSPAGRVEPSLDSARGRPLDSARGRSGSPFSLVRCRLITGRTHQIRAHLKAKGWPLVGDSVYGRPLDSARDRRATAPAGDEPTVHAARVFGRQALHAWRLVLRHPVTGADLSIVAPLPDDMRGLCGALGLPTL